MNVGISCSYMEPENILTKVVQDKDEIIFDVH